MPFYVCPDGCHYAENFYDIVDLKHGLGEWINPVGPFDSELDILRFFSAVGKPHMPAKLEVS